MEKMSEDPQNNSLMTNINEDNTHQCSPRKCYKCWQKVEEQSFWYAETRSNENAKITNLYVKESKSIKLLGDKSKISNQ